MKPRLFPPLLLALACGSVVLLHLLTSSGPGMVNDSAAYLSGARHLMSGQGYISWMNQPITHFPPLVSALLATLSKIFQADPQVAAGWINPVLFGINTALVGLLACHACRQSGFALLGAALFALSGPFLRNHSFVMSEPLFLLLCLVFLLLLEQYIRRRSRWSFFLGALVVGLAILCRYAGAFLLPVAIIGWSITPRRRYLDLIVFLAVSLPLPIAWFLRNLVYAGTASNRVIQIHPVLGLKLSQAFESVMNWFLPWWKFSLPAAVEILGFAFLCLLLWILLWMNRRGKPVLVLLLGSSLVYPIFVLLSAEFFDASILMDDRILVPLYTLLLVLMMAVLDWVWVRRPRTAVLASLAVAIYLLGSGVQVARVEHWDSQGYASSYWRNSPLLIVLRTNYSCKEIYATQPAGIYLQTGLPARPVASRFDPVTFSTRNDYQTRLADMRKDIEQGSAVLAVVEYRSALGDPALKKWIFDLTAGLSLSEETRDGAIFGSKCPIR